MFVGLIEEVFSGIFLMVTIWIKWKKIWFQDKFQDEEIEEEEKKKNL